MSLADFHPAVSRWFKDQFDAPTAPQLQAWPAIRQGRHALIAAPTGSGKTLAAFLAAIDQLVQESLRGELAAETQVVYVSPLKALGNDIQKNLAIPLQGIRRELSALDLPDVEINTSVRSGDTPASERAKMLRKPPQILVTTPESLYILLTSEGGRRLLSPARTVIVDEIHAMVGSKRGSHLALFLERLDSLTGHRLTRVGLSATQKPIDEVARFLVGAAGVDSAGRPDCDIVDTGHQREMDLALELPSTPLSAVMSLEVWTEIHDRLSVLIEEHRTTLIFVNTRRLAERLTRHLSERLGEENVTSHHGSLSRERRLLAEQRLKSGELRALVATASLELGIDIGDVDLVCQIGSTGAIATLLQRVGRSGHGVGGLPKGRVFPLSRDELVECVALLDAVRRRELDVLVMPDCPLDILAQHVVAASAAEEWDEEELFSMARRAWPFRALTRKDFDDVLAMLATGFSTTRGRRGALIHHDAVNGRVKGRRGARLAAVTSGGAIPDVADYDVVLEPGGTRVGSLNEDFAIESLSGDIFQLGNASWRILRVATGKVFVEDAHGQPPNMPFWLGEAPSRSAELSSAVARVRGEVGSRLAEDGAALSWLVDEVGVDRASAEQLRDYLQAASLALGAMPTQETLVLERFFDESGGMQLVLHSPFGSRLNRAWGLALRKRFCRSFNFELQAAATEDAIVLSLGLSHGFDLAEVFSYLHPDSVRELLIQAMLDAPMFPTRFRWNAARSLALPRMQGGKKVPPQLLRMKSDDLLASVFPDQQACLENIAGDRELPDHPLVNETVRDCLTEAMDIDLLEGLLADIREGRKTLVARDLPEPSALALEILNARPYAFLDDAPLEERRTQAVIQRRGGLPQAADDLGALDASAIERVCEEAWPRVGDADELHDALVVMSFLSEAEAARLDEDGELLSGLLTSGRATRLAVAGTGLTLLVAAERLPELLAVHAGADLAPSLVVPERFARREWGREDAVLEILRGRMAGLGPVGEEELAESLGVTTSDMRIALAALQAEGFAMKGHYRGRSGSEEWCERRLLARIQRYTLGRLRSEIAPVGTKELLRFLLSWQGLDSENQVSGPEGLSTVLSRLSGWEAAATSLEDDILPARVTRLERGWLDELCLKGRVTWGRLTRPRTSTAGRGPLRTTPIAFTPRAEWRAFARFAHQGEDGGPELSSPAQAVVEVLREEGACFLPELVDETGLLPSGVEESLGELVAGGLVTCDAFAGLRALLSPPPTKASAARRQRRANGAPARQVEVGRWDRLRRPKTASASFGDEAWERDVELVARALLRRWGVVFKTLLGRESVLPPWRDLLRAFRRLEARGEVRGGRFIELYTGEQFAHPEAVAKLRAQRRRKETGEFVSVSASDPMNVVGILTPGDKLPAVSGNRLLFRDGVPTAMLCAGEIRFLTSELDESVRWQAEKALRRQAWGQTPPRAVMGSDPSTLS